MAVLLGEARRVLMLNGECVEDFCGAYQFTPFDALTVEDFCLGLKSEALR